RDRFCDLDAVRCECPAAQLDLPARRDGREGVGEVREGREVPYRPGGHRPTTGAAPTAVNVSGLLIAPIAVAMTRLTPGTAPSVHEPTEASPSGPVTTEFRTIVPPPSTVNVTVTPATGL